MVCAFAGVEFGAATVFGGVVVLVVEATPLLVDAGRETEEITLMTTGLLFKELPAISAEDSAMLRFLAVAFDLGALCEPGHPSTKRMI